MFLAFSIRYCSFNIVMLIRSMLHKSNSVFSLYGWMCMRHGFALFVRYINLLEW